MEEVTVQTIVIVEGVPPRSTSGIRATTAKNAKVTFVKIHLIGQDQFVSLTPTTALLQVVAVVATLSVRVVSDLLVAERQNMEEVTVQTIIIVESVPPRGTSGIRATTAKNAKVTFVKIHLIGKDQDAQVVVNSHGNFISVALLPFVTVGRWN